MDGLTAPPRDHLTDAQVRKLLTGQGVTRGFGCELLDGDNNVVDDLGPDCKGFTVSRDNNAEVHGALRITLARELAWGRVRVRPYRILRKGGISARFNRGVFVLTTPDTNRGRTPVLFEVSGSDLLYPLTRQVGDTRSVLTGTAYLTALRTLLVDSGVGGTVFLDGDRADAVLPETRTWALSSSGPRWLDIANDLLAEIGYVDLFVDTDGNFRSRPVADAATRAPEWRFDTTDELTDVVAADRSETYDTYSAPNSWRFVRQPLGYEPFAGDESNPPDGIYDVENQSEGDSSIDSIGRVHVTHFLNVADQAALVAEGDRIVSADRRRERRITMRVDPLPIAAHADVVELLDAGRLLKMQVASWEEPTTGRGTWVLGGGPGGAAAARSEQSATATVTGASPLRVVVDGATTDSVAFALADDSGTTPTYGVGSRVRVTVRNPIPPLVNGIETT